MDDESNITGYYDIGKTNSKIGLKIPMRLITQSIENNEMNKHKRYKQQKVMLILRN